MKQKNWLMNLYTKRLIKIMGAIMMFILFVNGFMNKIKV